MAASPEQSVRVSTLELYGLLLGIIAAAALATIPVGIGLAAAAQIGGLVAIVAAALVVEARA